MGRQYGSNGTSSTEVASIKGAYSYGSAPFRTCKLVLGILSIALMMLVLFQSCAAGVVNSVTSNGEASGTGGFVVAIMMLSGGIVSIATRSRFGTGGDIACMILFALGCVFGSMLAGSVFSDLLVWSLWCLINAVIAVVSIWRKTRGYSYVPKIVGIAVVALCGIVLVNGFLGSGRGDVDKLGRNKTDSSDGPLLTSVTPGPDTPSGSSGTIASEGDLGKYHVAIGEARLSEDRSGAPVIIVTYSWTNGSDDTRASWVSVSPKAFQNGIELEGAMFVSDDAYDSGVYMADVRPGTTIDIQRAYVLSDPSAPVEFELTESISFSNDSVGKVFDLSVFGIEDRWPDAPAGASAGMEDANATVPVEPGSGVGDVGNSHVAVKGAVLSNDYSGAPAIVVTVSWTNNSSDTTSFMASVMGKAFQDGVQLETAIMGGNGGHDGQLYMTEVRPGTTLDVTLAYVLSNTSSIVEFELDKLITIGGGNPVSIEFDPGTLGGASFVSPQGDALLTLS